MEELLSGSGSTSCGSSAVNIIDIETFKGIINSCNANLPSECWLRDLVKLPCDGETKRIDVCISDPNEAIHCKLENCLDKILCIKGSHITEICPDLIICYRDYCSIVEVKKNIKGTRVYDINNIIIDDIGRKFSSACTNNLMQGIKGSCRKMFSDRCGKIIYIGTKLSENSKKSIHEYLIIDGKSLCELLKIFINDCIRGRRRPYVAR